MASKRSILTLTLLATLACGDLAWGAVETVQLGFSQPNALVGFEAFDPSLGTLTSVQVSIVGGVKVDVNTPVLLRFNGTGNVPVSYDFSAEVDENIGGVLSANSATSYTVSSVAPPGKTVTSLQINYNEKVTFNSATDSNNGMALLSVSAESLGNTVAIASSSAVATLSDFIGDPASGGFQISDPFNATDNTTSDGPDVSIKDFSGSGETTVNYTYTPTVPEPMGVAGLMALLPCVCRRRSKQSAQARE